MTPNSFIPVPETHLPCGRLVPAFSVSRYLCCKSPVQTSGSEVPESGYQAESRSDLPPWCNLSYFQAQLACQLAGWSLITESQWLAIAYDVARQPDNWRGGSPGSGRLEQGLRRGCTNGPIAPNCNGRKFSQESDGPLVDKRWKTLSNGHRLCDFGGNAWSWVFDDVQGRMNGTSTVLEAESISLTTAPFAPLCRGMGIRPRDRQDWEGRSLIRGGAYHSGDHAGAFSLYAAIAIRGYKNIGLRATRPI